MKSTFHSEISTEQSQDGSVTISFMASRGSAHDYNSKTLVIIAIALIIIGIPAILAFGLGLLMIAIGIGTLGRAYIYRCRPYQLIVIPGDGIMWDSNRLPEVDITKLGIITLQGQYDGKRGTGSRVSESSYVYAVAGGKQIQLTKNMPTARAEAILEVVRDCTQTTRQRAS